MAVKIQELRAEFTADLARLNKGIGKAQRGIAGFGKSVRNMGGTMTAFGAKMTKWGLLVGSITTGVGIALAKMAANFESEMGDVRTLLADMSDKEFKRLSQGVLDLSIDVAKSTKDLAGGLYEVVSAEVDAVHQTKVLALAAKAATAGVATTNEAMKLASAIVKGYGLSWEDTEMVMDESFMVVKKGQTTFAELASYMMLVVPIAAQIGVSLEELNGLYATLTGVTGNTVIVTTQLNSIMRGFLKMPAKLFVRLKDLTKMKAKGVKVDEETGKEVKGLIKRYKELSKAITPAMIKEKGLIATMQALMKATQGSETEVLELIGRAEGLGAIFKLTGDLSDVAAVKIAAMGDAAGAMAEAFGIKAAEFNFKWTQLTSALKASMIVIGDLIKDSLKPVIDVVRAWIKANRELLSARFEVIWERVKEAAIRFYAALVRLGRDPQFRKTIEGIRANLLLLRSNFREVWDEIMGRIRQAAGLREGESVFSAFIQTILGGFLRILEWTNEHWPEIKEQVVGVLNKIKDAAEKLTEALRELEKHPELKRIVKIIALLGVAEVAVGGVSKALLAVSIALGVLNLLGIGKLIQWIGGKLLFGLIIPGLKWLLITGLPALGAGAVAAVGLGVAALYLWITRWDEIIAGFPIFLEEAKKTFDFVVVYWKAMWGRMIDSVKESLDKITGALIGWWRESAIPELKLWKTAFLDVFAFWKSSSPSILGTFEKSLGMMQNTIVGFGEQLGAMNLTPVVTAALAGAGAGAITDNRRVDMNIQTDVDVELLRRAIGDAMAIEEYARRGI